MVGSCYLHALSAVGDARGGEVGDLEDNVGAGHGGGGGSEDGGGELHLDGCGGFEWLVERELEVVLSFGVRCEDADAEPI